MAKFPDLTGDGEVTQADILKGRGVYKKGGSVMKHDHGHKPTTKMSHGGHYCWGGKVMKKAVGGMASGGGGKPIDLGSTPSMKGGSGKPINFPIDLGSTPSMKGGGGSGGPARPMPPVIFGRPMPGGIKGKLQPVPLKPAPRELNNGTIRAPRELYLGGSKDFDESTGTYRGRPGGGMAFKKGGSIKGESEMKKSDSKMKVMKKAVGGGISGGPTRVGPKPMPSNPLNRGPISPMKKAMGGGISSPIGRPNTAKPMPSNPSNRGPIGNLPTRANPTAPRQSNPMDRGSISRMKKGGSAKGRKGMK